MRNQFLQSPRLSRLGRRGSSPLSGYTPLAAYTPRTGVPGAHGLTNNVTGGTQNSLLHVMNSLAGSPPNGNVFGVIGATYTMNAAPGPETGQRAVSVSNTNTTGMFYINLPDMPGTQYTLSFEARADTPVDVRSGKNSSEDVISITSTWQTFSMTMAHNAGSLLPLIYVRRHLVDYTVQIANIRLHEGNSDLGFDTGIPLAFETYSANSWVPSLPTASWSNNALIPLGIRRTFNRISGALQITGGASPSASGFVFKAGSTNTDFALRMNNYRRLYITYVGVTSNNSVRWAGIDDGQTAVLTWAAGPDGFTLLRNKLPMIVLPEAMAAFDVAYFALPLRTNLGADFAGGALSIFDQELTGDALRALDTQIVAEATAAGLTVTEPSRGFYPMGDSITNGSISDDTFYSYADGVLLNTAGLIGHNASWPGQALAQQEAVADRFIPHWQSAVAAGREVIVSLMIGRNDSSTLISDWSAYYNEVKAVGTKIKATGAKLIMCDILPSDLAGFNAARANFNAQLAADEGSWFDVHADFSGVVAGQDGTESNATYYSDGTHPTQAGHNNLYPVMQSAYDAAVA